MKKTEPYKVVRAPMPERLKGFWRRLKVLDVKGKIALVMFVLLIAGMVLVTVFLTPYIIKLIGDFKDIGKITETIQSEGFLGIVVVAGYNIFQVIVPLLPVEAIQLAAGAIYGSLWGAVLCVVSLMIGSVINYIIARFFGRRLLSLFFSEQSVDRLRSRVAGKKGDMFIFFIYLIPGIPKDLIAYAAGLAEYSLLKFTVLSTVARFPAVFCSTYIGAQMNGGNMFTAVIVFAMLAAVAIPCFFFGEKLIGKFSKN